MSNTIAIAHKDYDVRGGGEVLAERLSQAFDVPLYVGHGDQSNQPAHIDVDIREIAPESRWHRLMDMGGAARGIGHMMHWRDNAPTELADYDTIITSGNEPLWAMTQDQQTVIAYTHSTPRWMYDLYHEANGFVSRTYQQLQRRMYEGTVKRPDLYVANSDLVARRVNKYWNVPEEQIRIVYPPVDTHNFSPNTTETKDFYLHLGRLSGAKRIDEVVATFNELGADYPLLIAGDGPERRALEQQAESHITFLGYVSEDEKRRLMSAAKAHIYPAMNEDFGMVPVESMAAGTPVIGVEEGFTQFQIMDGENGYAYAREDDQLAETVRTFERDGVSWSADRIAGFAGRFGTEQFVKGMREAVAEAEELSDVLPSWQERQRDRPPVEAEIGGVSD